MGVRFVLLAPGPQAGHSHEYTQMSTGTLRAQAGSSPPLRKDRQPLAGGR